MFYLEYEIAKLKYLDAQKAYDDILTEKERMFSKTQPKGTAYDKELVSSGHSESSFDEYLIEKERKQIDDKLYEMKELIEERAYLLKVKERQLRESKALFDRIYCLKYLDNLKVVQIAFKVSYSESQVYRKLEVIEKMRENARKTVL